MTYDSKFAGYATRIAFDIRLTRPQIFYLSYVANVFHNIPVAPTSKERMMDAIEKGGRQFAMQEARPDYAAHDIFVPQVNKLIERGLVEHNTAWKPRLADESNEDFSWIYRLTPAGEHVVALLKIAGLFVQLPSNQAVA